MNKRQRKKAAKKGIVNGTSLVLPAGPYDVKAPLVKVGPELWDVERVGDAWRITAPGRIQV